MENHLCILLFRYVYLIMQCMKQHFKTSDRVLEEALYIALCGKKVLKLPCFGSVFQNGYTRNSSGVLIYLSLDKFMTKRVC